MDERLRVGGYRLFGAAPAARAALADVPVAAPLALVCGNEHEGLSPYARLPPPPGRHFGRHGAAAGAPQPGFRLAIRALA